MSYPAEADTRAREIYEVISYFELRAPKGRIFITA